MIYILNHHSWPDGSPSAIYADDLAEELKSLNNRNVAIVCTDATYRKSKRKEPKVPIIRLKSNQYERNDVLSLFKDYFKAFNLFRDFIHNNVQKDDTVIVTSSPFFNVFLINALKKKSAVSIYWLHDYFPDSLLSMGGFYSLFYFPFHQIWHYKLSQWNHVILPGINSDYHGKNSSIFRFWPTIKDHADIPTKNEPKKALYVGNIGIIHDVQALISEAKKWKNKGYEINFYADGPKAKNLPDWINLKKISSEKHLSEVLQTHDVHLVVGSLHSDKSSFPSKTWNSLYYKKKIVPVAFGPNFTKELKLMVQSDFISHKKNLAQFIQSKTNDKDKND